MQGASFSKTSLMWIGACALVIAAVGATMLSTDDAHIEKQSISGTIAPAERFFVDQVGQNEVITTDESDELSDVTLQRTLESTMQATKSNSLHSENAGNCGACH
tara:strand:+ start:709 stop:1020 length:312 start_codon:yes stop_codon:yes gene_type:complete